MGSGECDVCCMLLEPSREKRAAIGDARMSQSRSKCVFSQVSWQISALGLACPLYPTGCQLSLRKTERWRIKNEMEGGREGGGGDDVRTRAPRLSSSLVSHLSL